MPQYIGQDFLKKDFKRSGNNTNNLQVELDEIKGL